VRESPRDEAVEHDLHGVLAGEHNPAVGGEAGQRRAQRAEVVSGWMRMTERSPLRAVFLQRPHQVAGLFARSLDHNPAPF